MFVLGHFAAQSVAGTDTCEIETIRLRLTAVCPVSTEADNSLFFEDAKKPLITFELKESEAGSRVSNESFMASFGPSIPGMSRERAPSVIQSLNLLNESLFKTKFDREVTLAYQTLDDKPLFGNKNTKRMVAVFVCDDTNNNGKCSDEKPENQLSLRNPVFSACEIPKELAISVWAGCH